ncbi:MAG: MauE/DoxX family redox-associated membrane protein [Desulfobacteraceae bacterium]|jgi:uncharacterized membrane protein YphA (DoxX/SURF4 family)
MGYISRAKIRNSTYTICRIILGIIFVYSSWVKIIDPAAFARIITNYQIVSAGIGNFTALVLPWLELVCGLCLIINRWPRGSALIVTGLMVVFMTALGYNIYRGIDVSCGCFTLTEDAPGSMWLYMLRDTLLLGMAIGIVLHPRADLKLSNVGG